MHGRGLLLRPQHTAHRALNDFGAQGRDVGGKHHFALGILGVGFNSERKFRFVSFILCHELITGLGGPAD